MLQQVILNLLINARHALGDCGGCGGNIHVSAARAEDAISIVVADEDEVNALLLTDNYDDTMAALNDYDNLFAMTRSEKGSVIVHGDEIVLQDATPVETVVDTTGAGDAYTAGFLYGLAYGRSLKDSAELGTLCATRVIQQVGARIERGLLDDN